VKENSLSILEKINAFLPLVNTVLVFLFVGIGLCYLNKAYTDFSEFTKSGKAVNEALAEEIKIVGSNIDENMSDRFAEVKSHIFDPIANDVIKPLTESANTVNGFVTSFNPKADQLLTRAKANEEFALFVLSQMDGVEAEIYTEKQEENKEPAFRWAQRARVEVELIKWVAWNERDLIYRLSVKDTSIEFSRVVWSKPTKWMIKQKNGKPRELYEWLLENEMIIVRLAELDNLSVATVSGK